MSAVLGEGFGIKDAGSGEGEEAPARALKLRRSEGGVFGGAGEGVFDCIRNSGSPPSEAASTMNGSSSGRYFCSGME